jgi:hypothetical protein
MVPPTQRVEDDNMAMTTFSGRFEPMRYRITMIVAVLMVAAVAAQAGSDREFNAHWHDGKAELSGYELTVSRYGQERDGTCVTILVTEPFSYAQRVKVDNPTANPDDTFNALKLNLVRDFQTGVYDYNTMSSVFVHDWDFAPEKITFSSAEWCGHVFEQLLFTPDGVTVDLLSYFQGESDRRDIERPAGGMPEDNLFILLRGLRGDFLVPGESTHLDVMPSPYYARMAHKAPAWVGARIKREKKSKTVKVPAGKFDTIVYEVDIDGRKGTYYIEEDYPHRIVRWQMLPDVDARLAGSERLEYWRLNRNGDESYLKKIGLR